MKMMMRGGNRIGAGRPRGSGKFGEPTKAVRVPLSALGDVLRCVQNQFYRLPFYQHTVSAGFPSPAADDMEDKLDLNELLIKHPAATFFLRVSGSSMIKAGIHHNDILVVDRSLEPVHGKIVIAVLNGELTVKRLHCTAGKVQLVAENNHYPPIDVTPEMEFCIWGVVTSVIHSV
jgi:DNA polymerase V